MDLFGLFLFIFSYSIFPFAYSQPIFKPVPTSQDAIDGRWATLQCGIAGSDEQDYTISWLSGGKSVVNDNRRYQEGNNLYFRPIDKDFDGGQFQCQATEISSGRNYVTDPVEFKIKWLRVGNVKLKKPSSPTLVLPGVAGGVVLECGITGYPKPNNISWFANGRLIRWGGSGMRKRGGKLIINPVRMNADDGEYTCCASHLLAAQPNRYQCTPSGGEFALQVLDRSTPRLVKVPQDKVVARGGNAMLDCVYEAVPSPDIVWRKNGSIREITNKPRRGRCARSCVHINGSLELVHMKKSMEGEYICLARQGALEAQPVSAAVKLAYIEEFPTMSTERYGLLGERLEYDCAIPLSLPNARVTWTRAQDRRVIDESNSRISTIRMSTLVIDTLRRDDVGLYTCTAANMAGRVSTDVVVKLGVAPAIGRLINKHTDEGSNISWNCPASGMPFPYVTWYKNDVKIDGSSGSREMDGANLVLINVTMADQGLYKCTATNQVSNSEVISSNPAQLTITERLKFWPVLKDICIAAGEDQQVVCSVNGSGNPTITWTRLLGGVEAPIISQSSSGSTRALVFTDPGASDAGIYTCTATTPSTAISTTIRIYVVVRPRIVVPPHDVAVFEGKRAMLDCATSPNERSKVTWEFSDKLYSASQRGSFERDVTVFPNGSLLIPRTQAKDAGFYTCSYNNCGVAATAIAELTVAEDVPEGPDDPSLPPGGPTSGMIQTIALAVSGGIAYVLITVALIIYCRRKRRKKRKSQTGKDEEEKMLNGTSTNGRSQRNHDDEIVMMKNGIAMKDMSELDPRITRMNYSSTNIHPITVLGKGEFGDVFLSKAPGLDPEAEEERLFMVKTYHPHGSSKESRSSRSEFIREVNLLFKSTHDNVSKLLAVGSKYSKAKPDFFVSEYLDWGILKLCLKASKEGEIPNISKSSKMNLCCQIAGGLEHLNKLGFIHKDLAARNCVVSSNLLVKISMIGLSRQGFETDYHEHDGALVPIRWMAPESLLEGKQSSQSDVWSFGVTCWEIFSFGESPYDELTNDEYVTALRSDNIPHLQPLEGVKRMSALIKKCCLVPPSERPEIKQITRKLQSIVGSGEGSINGQLSPTVFVPTATGDSATDAR